MAKIRNRRTPEGEELGRELARMCDESEPRARLLMPELPPRCASCAFREGPHVANGSPETLMDALKCVMEKKTFGCHEPARDGQPCSGWAMMSIRAADLEPVAVPWDFKNSGND